MRPTQERGMSLVLGAGRGRHPNRWAHKETPMHRWIFFGKKNHRHIVHMQPYVLSYALSWEEHVALSLWWPPVFVPEANSHNYSMFWLQCCSVMFHYECFWGLTGFPLSRIPEFVCQTGNKQFCSPAEYVSDVSDSLTSVILFLSLCPVVFFFCVNYAQSEKSLAPTLKEC